MLHWHCCMLLAQRSKGKALRRELVQYGLQRRDGLTAGAIILVGTDGIWETSNTRGDMFGRKRARDILRQYAGAPAATIRDRLVEALKAFSGGVAFADDVTLVVLKLDPSVTARGEATTS